jgi:hypothetical protein
MAVSCGISRLFNLLFRAAGQVAHVLLTRPPLGHPIHSALVSSNAPNLSEQGVPVRLACVRRAASVRPEPGSNS